MAEGPRRCVLGDGWKHHPIGGPIGMDVGYDHRHHLLSVWHVEIIIFDHDTQI